MRKLSLVFLSLAAVALLLTACGESGPVKNVNYKSVLSGTFVYSGSVPGSGPMTITLKLNSHNRSFEYSEAGGITNRKYSGSYVVLGNQVVFTNGKKETSKHTVEATNNGFKLTCTDNRNPISFGLQPLEGSTLEYYKQ